MNAEPLSQYIYGVIPAAAQGVVAPAVQASGNEIIGHDGVRVIVYEDIAAIVSPAKQVDITKMRKDVTARMLIAHQKVIELIMQGAATVLPFRLGTYAPSEESVTEILLKGQKLIRPLFEAIGGKIEMDVVVTWADFAAVLKEISSEDEIKKLKQSLASNPKGVSVDDQMKVGLMIKEALDRKRLEICRQITEKLKSASCAQCRHENMDDQMILNSAFLIEAKRRPEFERVLDELNTQFAEKINFRCVGPLAPYSFYTLELKTIRWEDVDWARRIMGLGDTASAEEIKKAFQQAARATHPDHCGQSAETERSFNDLNSARRIVLEYAQACEQTVKEEQIIFSEEKVRQNSLLVKVRNGNSSVA
ncbi:MAG: GvpL/GvpF family gas vesicle protein [Actinobacteria bacterium]|nr:GvpL/GvpF family gas vesicle protein [Actinomycetota bacterium]MCG2679388.1 GvpL/GvpF family gas vesicle protein [Kiritimatiellia bacterium]